MTTGPEILRTILLSPADDYPRLVYSDWLQENCQVERGEFIRMQVEFEHTLCCQLLCEGEECPRTAQSLFCNNSSCRHCMLDHRVSELLGRLRASLGNEMIAEEEYLWLPEALQDMWREVRHLRDKPFWVWRRGFISHIELSIEQFGTHAAAIFGCQPVESVKLLDVEPIGARSRPEGPVSWFNELWILLNQVDYSNLPLPLYKLLTSGVEENPCNDDYGQRSREYQTADEAFLDLSQACVLCGRAAAGLTEQTAPTQHGDIR